MNTIERVARAIAKAFADGLGAKVDLDEISVRWTPEAKAALEALCEGLEWRDDEIHKLHDLHLNGKHIGSIGQHSDGAWDYALLNEVARKVFKTADEARDALMQAARSWIMGVET